MTDYQTRRDHVDLTALPVFAQPAAHRSPHVHVSDPTAPQELGGAEPWDRFDDTVVRAAGLLPGDPIVPPSTLPRPPTLAAVPYAPQVTPPPPPPAPASSSASDLPRVLNEAPPATFAASRQSPAETVSAVDWSLIALLRTQASERLASALSGENVDAEAQQELGRKIIQDLMRDTENDRVRDGDSAWTIDERVAIQKAVFNALFGLGRLQPLIDDDSVENIIISGAANVWVERDDGSLTQVEPVAESDEELVDFLNFIAARAANPRPFSSASPRLHMRLPDGSRLASAAWVTARPSVVIRRHRLRRVFLEDLVRNGTISALQQSFLAAAIKAHKSVVVSGAQGAGKTTLVRALCAEINSYEAIGTFETEYELHLHELPDIHPIVHAWEARPGSGEIGADGRPAGQFTLMEALYDSFRFNLARQIVGEVRGEEVWAMIKAMESGAGSISTTHAAGGEAALRKLVTCAMEAGSHVTKELATAKLAETIDLVVHVSMLTEYIDAGQWHRTRHVSEIVHVAPGEAAKGYATTRVFTPAEPGQPAVPGILPDELRELEAYGFDLNSYLAHAGRGRS